MKVWHARVFVEAIPSHMHQRAPDAKLAFLFAWPHPNFDGGGPLLAFGSKTKISLQSKFPRAHQRNSMSCLRAISSRATLEAIWR